MDNHMNIPNTYYQPEELKDLLKLLSCQNTLWTRNYIVSYLSNHEDTIVVENRLYENAIDFKKVFNIYYHETISKQLEGLLREYTSNLIDTLKYLKSGEKDMEEEAQDKWNTTGIKLAEFLSSINSYWKLGEFSSLISDHIEMTKSQMEQRLNKEYALEVFQYDFIEYHSIMIANILSQGIIDMFY